MTQNATTTHIIGLLTNVALAALKLVIGFIAASEALTADGFNSAGDILATAIGFAGYLYARKPADDDHHYGHGNAESVAGLVIGAMLLATGTFIFLHGVIAVVEGRPEPPGELALYAALITMVVKEALYRYTIRVGRKFNSPSLLATARDHRADVVLSLTVAAGIFFARAGAPILDPVAAGAVGIYVAWLAFDPIKTNFATLMDQAPPGIRDAVHEVALRDPDVLAIEQIRVHPLGSYYVVDFEIRVEGSLTVLVSHEIAHRVANAVQASVEHVQSVNVHVNPAEGDAP